MSLAAKIEEKLAGSGKLSDDEVQWAADHSMALPEEYADHVRDYQAQRIAGRPYDPLMQTGAAFAQPNQSGPGVFLSEDDLNQMNKDMLVTIGEATGVELSGTKAQMVATLSGGGSEEQLPADETMPMSAALYDDDDENEEG